VSTAVLFHGQGVAVEPGSVLADGRYVLTDRVGAGGVGEVWRATDTVLDRAVAVKLLRPDVVAEAGTLRRFAAEARVMARVDHPGIAAVYDFGQDVDDTAYLVMKFVDGEPLNRLLDRCGPLVPERVMELVAQAAEALRAAHDAGVIHRDVKPGNLIVRPDGSVVLTDFGIARVTGNDVTGVELIRGTAKYLAPEQATGGEITPAVDVYALGTTAYHCLAGQPPFDGTDPIDVAIRQVHEAPPPLPGRVPEPVRELLNAMLAKDPQDRPGTAEVIEAARRAAVPVPRAVATAGRRPTGLALVIVPVVLALGGLSALAFWPDPAGGGPVAGAPGYAFDGGIGQPSASPTAGGGSSPPSVSSVATTQGVDRLPRQPEEPSIVPRAPRTTPAGGHPATTRPPASTTSPTAPPSTTEPPYDPHVPYVVGMTLADASGVLQGEGYLVGVVTYDPAGTACVVMSQTPPADASASPGTAVDLVVGESTTGCT
jgi:tRNA A-37 threonylcarbamoyl transferase component Bud32